MKRKFRTHRHLFVFKVLQTNGKVSTITRWARVINAKLPVTLDLRAEDVRRSIQMGGVGNTQTCSMAVCANRQADRFPHPVEGYIDWQYSRCYVVTKLGKDGLPSECVCYRHDDDIAKLNDSRGGQEKLLHSLEKDGDRKIHLIAPQAGNHKSPVPGVKKLKARKRFGLNLLRGANKRFAVAQLGGIPD